MRVGVEMVKMRQSCQAHRACQYATICVTIRKSAESTELTS